MECAVCNGITAAVQVIFLSIFYLFVMIVNLGIAIIDWVIHTLTKESSPKNSGT